MISLSKNLNMFPNYNFVLKIYVLEQAINSEKIQIDHSSYSQISEEPLN